MQLKNFRCFETLDITFKERMSVIVGINGAGKSSVLDAASIAIGSMLLGIDGVWSSGILSDDVRYVSYHAGSKLDLQPQFPVTITADGELQGEEVRWSRSLRGENGKTTSVDAKQLSNISANMQKKIRRGNMSVVIPLISYYSTGRLWAKRHQKKSGLKHIQSTGRFSGYFGCLDTKANEQLLMKWFEEMTMIELQERRTIPELSAVRGAIEKFYTRMTNHTNVEFHFRLATKMLEFEYTNEYGDRCKVPLKDLSDGYQNTLNMIADIAYRMATLNPQLLENVIEETPGIVLIDEVDLHLHPTWQQRILHDLMEIFPKVQFIVTTHAPAVIQSIQTESLIILDHSQTFEPPIPTYGRDANSVLSIIMGTSTRPKEVQDKFKELDNALSESDLEKARVLLSGLEDQIGDGDPDLIAARISLELEEWED